MAEKKEEQDPAAKAAALGAEFQELMNSVDSEGIAWTAATSQAIAYDRMVESEREDRLFTDALAKYFVGERGERISEVINDALSMHFRIEGFHRLWTALRTKYINDVVVGWIESLEKKEKKEGEEEKEEKEGEEEEKDDWQVTNLGCGVDTRAFWLDCLTKGKGTYVEVDVESITKFKERELGKIKEVKPLCRRQVITMDFEKESLEDMPKHGYNSSPPTLWILEGLIMYIKKVEVIKMINHIDALSSTNSCVTINYLTNPDPENAANIEYIENILFEKGWEGERHCCGGEVIDYGRFPKDTPPAENMGFGTYYKKSDK